jgi:hypothetical protein
MRFVETVELGRHRLRWIIRRGENRRGGRGDLRGALDALARLTVDSSAVLEWLDARTPRHSDVLAAIATEQRPFLLPATLDRRHFDVVGRELGLEVLPT